ncbi:hydroxyacylglutathione hydrolase [Azomonas macrocytogenes]|uniref:Hydroxyacylglutathione hydrolase n=1 Tax=Azomonas macrocytogenes TaxID=69962 RepID=A0A839T7T3_AZOMA|nr:hydroxyacylglutathione hydrolase [Azomonas macrocytogenes]MBB3104526.1 hydroxyacylglutathione hydrolase [Azomonas macrocytogenes]
MLKIEAIPAFSDNYIWLLQDNLSQRCAAVDPGDAEPVLSWLNAHPDWQLTDILVTHHHQDHTGGVTRLKQETSARVAGPASEPIPARDLALTAGDLIEVLGQPLKVFAVPGHTLGHIAYFHDSPDAPFLFSGDTLFAGGCGRIFEGTPAQMLESLRQLAALPLSTMIYCAHEYTLSNLRFARAVEPQNKELAKRFEDVTQLRAKSRITLPSSLAEELATNPFLRCEEPAVRAAAIHLGVSAKASTEEIFAAIRAWKDKF